MLPKQTQLFVILSEAKNLCLQVQIKVKSEILRRFAPQNDNNYEIIKWNTVSATGCLHLTRLRLSYKVTYQHMSRIPTTGLGIT
jgi:hypothetical protein